MRPDFNKLLTERERVRHGASFRDVRHIKVFKKVDDEGMPVVGMRESMETRHNYGGWNKEFNENLNPLKGYLRTRVGKPWNKTYSEIRANFDARKVINNHILQHLFDYVNVDTFIGHDGKVWVRRKYGYHACPVSEDRCDYYVNPRDGRMLANARRESDRQRIASRKAKRLAESLKIKRVIDETNELHLVDGTWFHYTLKPVPEKVREVSVKNGVETITYVTPPYVDIGEPNAHPLRPTSASLRRMSRMAFYYASRRTASKKMLKEHGLLGTATA